MVNDAGLIFWHKLDEEIPENLEGVVFAKWVEEESCWYWFASGAFIAFAVWIDIYDYPQDWQGVGFDKPTHWCIAPLWGKPE